MNLDSLSSSLQAKIKKKPLLTILKTKDKSEIFDQYIICENIKIPQNFNGKEIWKDFLNPVFNQGNCGSCWAFASTSCLSNRFNIFAQGQINLILSPAKLVLCDFQGKLVRKKSMGKYDFPHPESELDRLDILNQNYKSHVTRGCYGNTLKDAWRFLYLFGSVSQGCIPYDFDFTHENKLKQIPSVRNYGPLASNQNDYVSYSLSEFKAGRTIPNCQSVTGPINDMCYNYYIGDYHEHNIGTPARFWRCISYYNVPGISTQNGGSPLNVQREIYLRGPVTSGFDVYPDFYQFDATKEIYKWNGIGPKVGGHAVEIVGWGNDNNVEFWWIKNSWGPKWGIQGYFKMIKGINNCGIEENVSAGIPDFFKGVQNNSELQYISKLLSGNNLQLSKRQSIDIGIILPDMKIPVTGGGIDPTNGFTRRVLGRYPGIDFSLNNLLNVSTINQINNAYQINKKKYKLQHKWKTDTKNNKKDNTNIIIVLCIISICLLFLLLYFSENKKTFKNNVKL